MKKQLQLLLIFVFITFSGWTQSINFTSVPTSTNVGTNITVNYKYTTATAGKVTFFISKNGGTNPWDYISAVAYSEKPTVVGTDVSGSFTILISNGTSPTSSLTGNQNYRFTLELRGASNNWLAGDYSFINYNFTAAATATPAISVISIPTSTQAGTNLVVNYKYTAAASGKTTIAVTKNGGTNAYDFISTVGFIELNPAVAGTDVTGTFTVPIPAETTPTSGLTGNENYRVTLELKNSSDVFLAGDYSTVGYNIIAAPVTPAISITSIPTSTQAGTNLVVNYKYTAADSGKTTIAVTKNGGKNAYDYISTVGFIELNPAVAGTDVTGTFTVPIPAETTPTSGLTGNENYRVTLELKNSSDVFLAGDYSTINYNITPTIATTWTGGTSTAWTDASNWSNGAPDATKDVTVGTGTFQPVISTNVNIKSLTLNASTTLTVNSGFNLTVTDAIVNNGSLTIANNANLIQVNDVFNAGSVTVNRIGNSLTRNEYTIWSSPVHIQNLLAFSPNTLQLRFYNYNETNNKFSVVAGVASVPFSQGAGYLIRMPDNWVGSQAYAGSFSGIPNNGNISKTVAYSGATFGYNMVGNPYPSTIDANTFITANSANIESSLYFWRKINNASSSAYAVYNAMGSTATPSSALPNGKIQVGQGFFVKAKPGAISISFNNAMREANNANQIFKTKQAAQKDRLWLNMTNNTGVFSQTLVGYTANASLDVDQYDAKYFNDSKIALTSNINNEEYSIQGRPSFDATDVVALNFKTDSEGDYSIALDHFDGVFATGQDVYLVDSKSGIETNLKENAYTFNASVGTDNTRFSLKFQKTLKATESSLDENSVSVYQNNGSIYINSKSVAISSVKVFDVHGRLLAEQRNLKANTATISNLRVKNQILIVNVVGEDNSGVSKKIMN